MTTSPKHSVPLGQSQWGAGLTKSRARSCRTGVSARPGNGPPPVLGAKEDENLSGMAGGHVWPQPTDNPRIVCVWRWWVEEVGSGGRAGRVGGGSLLPGWSLLGYSWSPAPVPTPRSLRICSEFEGASNNLHKGKDFCFTLNSHGFRICRRSL